MGLNLGSGPLSGGAIGSTPLKGIAVGDTVVWTAGGGEVVPVTFDAVGAGDQVVALTSSPVNLSWTHTASGDDRAVLVFVMFAKVIGTGTPTRTATYGGNAMTSLGVQGVNNQALTTTSFQMEIFGLLNPPAGAQTVSVTISLPAASFNAAANSVSYNNVGSFGSITKDGGGPDPGTSLSQTVSSAADRRVVQAFLNGTVGDYSQTTRFSLASSAAIVGDAAGAASVNFTATRSNAAAYAEIAVDLLPE